MRGHQTRIKGVWEHVDEMMLEFTCYFRMREESVVNIVLLSRQLRASTMNEVLERGQCVADGKRLCAAIMDRLSFVIVFVRIVYIMLDKIHMAHGNRF